ncbi:lactococcin 972 family bacteriocin [Streptosporangium sp. NPDC051022]|uniref:lactococcin 972 family bacteriocin n=1 Tax=Streptosporangium sp. NPDC051022 TaxID=3155752 RepID=UPI003427D401
MHITTSQKPSDNPLLEELMGTNHAVKRILKGTVIAAAGIVLIGGPAYAVVENVGGGSWDHGFNYPASEVYSNYYHGSYCHGSTAVGVYTDRSPATKKGSWSEASAPIASFNNETYWRHEAESHCS